jgi:hypothetical protein
MVPLVFRFKNFRGTNAFSDLFSQKTSVLKDLCEIKETMLNSGT